MKKYFRIAKNTWDERVVYRLNFLMWRAGIIMHVVTLYYLWYAVLPENNGILFGYTQTTMFTYILVLNLIAAFVTPTRSYAIGEDILSGKLSNFLIRPMNYFLYWAAKDVGDRITDMLFSIVELAILFLLLRPPLFVQTDPTYLLLCLIAMVFSTMLYFFFNLILGFIGFWSSDIWAPRLIFYTIVSFLAGAYFPLDILPKPIFSAFQFLPFGFLLYFPVKIYLGQLSAGTILSGFLMTCIWLVFFYYFVNFLWRRGLRLYTAQGR